MPKKSILRLTILVGSLLLPISGMAHEALVDHANPHQSVLADLLPGTDLIIVIAIATLIAVGAICWIARRKT